MDVTGALGPLTAPSPVARDRASWGPGPWQDEPDHEQWSLHGYDCVAHRHPTLGHWCGYVGIPPNHPADGQSYDDLDISVHGGLTFSGYLTSLNGAARLRNWKFVGFDCGHAGDLSPGLQHLAQSPQTGRYADTYRTLSFVKKQVAFLAQQLYELEQAANVSPA